MSDERIMVDCDCAGVEPPFVVVALRSGAPIGNICKACGEWCEVDAEGLTLPHKHPDILAMIERGDFDACDAPDLPSIAARAESENFQPPFIGSLWLRDADKTMTQQWNYDGPYWYEDGDCSSLVSAGDDRVGLLVPIQGAPKADANVRLIVALRNVLPEIVAVVEAADACSGDHPMLDEAMNALDDKLARITGNV